MRSIEIGLAVIFLFLYKVDATLPKCAEFDQSGMIARELEKDSKALPFQDKLEQLFNAFEKNDTASVESIYKSLETIRVDDDDDVREKYTENLIKSVPDRIKSHGYPAEVHQLVTEDGYKLDLYRIPYGVKSPKTNRSRPAIILVHGFGECSNGWIVLGPENSLAYLLADNDYDVWIFGARGTEQSRGHVSLNSKQREYWDFSWHEIAIYDLTACIDYILSETKMKRLNYVGFSQGTTVLLVLASLRPEYNDKIIEANLLGPVAYLKGNRNSLFNAIAHYYKPLKRIFQILRIFKITIDNKFLVKITEIACKRTAHSTPFACKLVLSIFGSTQINCTSLPAIFINTPAGVSVRQGIHYIQLIRDGGFRQFDYEDKKINQKIYGSITPPDYNLTRITVPINIFHSKDDTTASFENVIQLKSVLPNLKSTYLVPVADFIHVDFTYSRYVRKILNGRLIETINSANRK
ncbi:lipase 3-like [Contarinia nasturtii]|uniref:lipase 3-like n=1 Tax=Contarinia nasturtii TaxID=265458 RepID=UPI0012D4B31A|nr:lipase 3-like [Contarinia nasturtii]